MKVFSRFVDNIGKGILFVAVAGLYFAALGFVGWQFFAALFAGSVVLAVVFGVCLVALLIVLGFVFTS